jgi:DNA-binding response OmpR family regulator
MMPEMDGFEFLERLRARTDLPEPPVLVLTAKELTEEDREFLSGRARQILHKGEAAVRELVPRVRELWHAGDTG